LRFGLFAYGNPTDGLWMIIMSCVVYGMAFDFLISQDLCLLKPIQNQKIVRQHKGYS
jgi:NHS family xanthosine MFS transporter